MLCTWSSAVKNAQTYTLKNQNNREAIFVRLEQPCLNTGSSLNPNLSSTYNTVLSSLPKQVNTRSPKCKHSTLTWDM